MGFPRLNQRLEDFYQRSYERTTTITQRSQPMDTRDSEELS